MPGRERDGNASGDPRTEELIGTVRVDSARSESRLSGPIREESRPDTRLRCGNAGAAPAISPQPSRPTVSGGRGLPAELSTTFVWEKTNNRHSPSRRRLAPHGKPWRMNSPALSHTTFKNASTKGPDDPQRGRNAGRLRRLRLRVGRLGSGGRVTSNRPGRLVRNETDCYAATFPGGMDPPECQFPFGSQLSSHVFPPAHEVGEGPQVEALPEMWHTGSPPCSLQSLPSEADSLIRMGTNALVGSA